MRFRMRNGFREIKGVCGTLTRQVFFFGGGSYLILVVGGWT